MPLPLRCANCKSYITLHELAGRRPPIHPWKLTADGQRVLVENEQRGGENPQCTECGQRTLIRP